jgi:hypothetical protein
MPKTPESPKPPTADVIAELAGRGEDISPLFTRKGKRMPKILPAMRKTAASYMKYDIVEKC